MTMRAFMITSETRAAMAELRAFAERPENFYRVCKVAWVPGHRPEFVRLLDSFRVVYSITVLSDQSHWRHLTVSIVGMAVDDQYPNLMVAFTIATMLGFTGGKVHNDVTLAPGPWEFDVNPIERCVLLLQPMEPA